MNIKTIFESRCPWADVLHGTVAEADFAADLRRSSSTRELGSDLSQFCAA